MQEELFEEFKEAVQKKKQEIGYSNARIEAARLMEDDPRIKTYLELCGVESAIKGRTAKFDIVREFDRIIDRINPNDTNKLYVDYGTFAETGEFDHTTMEYREIVKRVPRDDEKASFRCYWDVELREPIKLPIAECEEFEKNNSVISISMKRAKEEFLTTALTSSQEEATKVMCKLYGIKKRG